MRKINIPTFIKREETGIIIVKKKRNNTKIQSMNHIKT